LIEYKPHEYQVIAEKHILENPYCGLFLEMGLGKTVTTLTAIDELMYNMFEVSKVLVIAPLRVALDTWSTEIDKWRHLKHLRLSKVLGNEKQRKEALRQKADIYITNRENVPWLVGYTGMAFDFDMVVIDELSSFKSAKAQRFKSLRQVRPGIKRVVGLTGTPAPNGLIDLWPQLYLLDRGQRLGLTITSYRQDYFVPGMRNGQVVFNYELKEQSEERIYNQISDICISMKSRDYLNLPEKVDNYVKLNLDPKTKKMYDVFEREQVLSLFDSEEITAVNAAALTNKLLQFANGAVYSEDKNAVEMHKAKIEALEEILEEANGKPVLVFYSYKSDLARIKKYLKHYNPKELSKGEKSSDDIKAWNRGETRLLLVHPQSAGHGLNLQQGGSIAVWFGLTWSLESYQQANARLHRQGQTNTVIIHHLVANGTVDEDVIKALANKNLGQESLLEAVKARADKYLNGCWNQM